MKGLEAGKGSWERGREQGKGKQRKPHSHNGHTERQHEQARHAENVVARKACHNSRCHEQTTAQTHTKTQTLTHCTNADINTHSANEKPQHTHVQSGEGRKGTLSGSRYCWVRSVRFTTPEKREERRDDLDITRATFSCSSSSSLSLPAPVSSCVNRETKGRGAAVCGPAGGAQRTKTTINHTHTHTNQDKNKHTHDTIGNKIHRKAAREPREMRSRDAKAPTAFECNGWAHAHKHTHTATHTSTATHTHTTHTASDTPHTHTHTHT